jgi:predicted permease
MPHDIKYAVRAFFRSPGFSLVAVITLALGIGATTAMFSVVHAVLLKPLPYAAAERLVVVRMSLPDFRDIEERAQSFDDMAVWASNLYNLRTDSGGEQVLGGVVSRDLFPLLGVEPVLGRNFTAEDERADTVILGYGLWQSRYGGDPGVLGRAINLGGTSFTVIGVAPSWFRFPSDDFELWTPLGLIESRAPGQARNRALRIFRGVGRLKAGTTLEQARAELTTISADLARSYPETNADIVIAPVSLKEDTVGAARPALLLLLGTVALLLLIACANVANLLLARTTAREREIAIRSALGAGRGRLMRQLATESVILALAGGVLGVLVAMWGVEGVPSMLQSRVPRSAAVRVDVTVLGFALGATMLTALLFGLAPALHTVGGAATGLKDSARTVVGTRRGRRLRSTIAAAEIALAVIVVVGAGLLLRSFTALTAQDLGFRPENLLSFNVQFVQLPTLEARAQAAEVMIDRVGALPGVVRAGAATGLPAVTPQRGTRFDVEGRTLTPDESGSLFIAATPGFFEAAGTPVLKGRAIDASDRRGGEPVAVISRVLADRIFPGQDPVGRRLRLVNPEQGNEWRTIVGVVGDVQYRDPAVPLQPTIYTPFAQTPFMWLYAVVRTAGDPQSVMRAIPTAVSSADPALTAANVRPMAEIVASAVAEPRLNMQLVAGFAALALVLAAVGIYGVIAYSVAQRTQEIGIRMALGAAASDVLRLVLREGLVLAATGVAVGLVGSMFLTRLMRSLLFGVSEKDPIAFASGALLLVVVALLASYIPAARALRVNPITALRVE